MGQESCRWEVTVCQPAPWELQPACCRGQSVGLVCGFPKRNTLRVMSHSQPPSQSLWSSQRTQTVCSPGLFKASIWIKLLPGLSTQLMALSSLICNFSLSFYTYKMQRNSSLLAFSAFIATTFYYASQFIKYIILPYLL